MQIRGEEYGVLFTIGASIQIAKLCPGKDIKRLGEALKNDDYEKTIDNVCEVIIALNGGFVASEALMGRKAKRITKEILLSLPTAEFNRIQSIVTETMASGSKGEIKAKPTSKAKKSKTEATE